MSYILLGEPAAKIYGGELNKMGLHAIALPRHGRLNAIVSTHADTLIFTHGDTCIINKEYLELLPDCIKNRFIPVNDCPMGTYPTDTVFNAAVCGQFLFARLKSLSPAILSYAEIAGLIPVNVNQGYAKCSTLTLPQTNAAITADEGIAEAMEKVGIDVLKISHGHIALNGCDYGFIGGASFLWERAHGESDSRRVVCFFGHISAHPDASAIRNFIENHGYEVLCLSGKLTDFGGAVVFS